MSEEGKDKITWKQLPLSMKIPLIWFWAMVYLQAGIILAMTIILIFNIPI